MSSPRVGDRRSTSRRGHGEAGAPRTAAGLGRRQAERDDIRPRAAPEEQTAVLIRISSSGRCCPRRVTAGAPRARRRHPTLRGAVRRALSRAGLDRRALATGDPPGHHRRTLRTALLSRRRSWLRDAAVVGKVFWASALASGVDGAEPASTRSSGKDSYAAKALIGRRRNRACLRACARPRCRLWAVARADRVEKHRHVAEWVESLGRPDDHAEMLAHHLVRGTRARPSSRPGRRRAGGPRAASPARCRRPRVCARCLSRPRDAYYTEAIELWPLRRLRPGGAPLSTSTRAARDR